MEPYWPLPATLLAGELPVKAASDELKFGKVRQVWCMVPGLLIMMHGRACVVMSMIEILVMTKNSGLESTRFPQETP